MFVGSAIDAPWTFHRYAYNKLIMLQKIKGQGLDIKILQNLHKLQYIIQKTHHSQQKPFNVAVAVQ